jgi:uncharacterized protein (DUF1330 family)
MSTYAVGVLSSVTVGPDIVTYLKEIDASLVPFRGRFLIHGGPQQVLEGKTPGDLIVIEFPDRAAAAGWYASPAYQAILPLRLKNAVGDVLLIDGVSGTHQALDVLNG